MIDHYPLPLAKFFGNRLKMSGISVHQKVVNLYISYIINTWETDLNSNYTIDNCLFGFVKLAKNAHPDK